MRISYFLQQMKSTKNLSTLVRTLAADFYGVQWTLYSVVFLLLHQSLKTITPLH
jgi:hypothetical protein